MRQWFTSLGEVERIRGFNENYRDIRAECFVSYRFDEYYSYKQVLRNVAHYFSYSSLFSSCAFRLSYFALVGLWSFWWSGDERGRLAK
ncbi:MULTISPECIES: hypothetical protein [unclassified Bartonella]|uniref:hypothetical protein n=1 Tax=unclassified Bartonella TaxID=2645622 RepID=UPI00235FFB02|nr:MULTISPECIES: hypothetical protein [unclassified Bartonella]